MSERRHRSGGGKRALLFAAWGVPTALLAANIVMFSLNQKEGEPSGGFLTPEILQAAGLWLPALAALTLATLGLFWSTKAYAQSERSSLLWVKRGSIFSLVGVIVFLMAVFDAETFKRDWLAVVAMAVLAGQTVFVAMLAFREFKRVDGEPGRRGRARGPESFGPQEGDASPTAEKPGVPG